MFHGRDQCIKMTNQAQRDHLMWCATWYVCSKQDHNSRKENRMQQGVQGTKEVQDTQSRKSVTMYNGHAHLLFVHSGVRCCWQRSNTSSKSCPGHDSRSKDGLEVIYDGVM